MPDPAAFSATVHGRVQGVGFRYSTRSMAHRLGVRGYVQNQSDGTVRVEAEGEEKAVRKLADWLESGPPAARVTHVDLRWKAGPRGYRSFTVES